MRGMKLSLIVVFAGLLVILVGSVSADSSNATVVRHYPYEGGSYIQCANNGQGEWVNWSGVVRIHWKVNDQPNGSFLSFGQYVIHSTGIGQTTGDVWTFHQVQSEGGHVGYVSGTASTWQLHDMAFYNGPRGLRYQSQLIIHWVQGPDGDLIANPFNFVQLDNCQEQI